MKKPMLFRQMHVQRLRSKMERGGFPRLFMLLLIAVTGGVGFIASALMLRAGFDIIWARYLCALLLAYLAFVAMLWIWLKTSRRLFRYASDFPDIFPGVRSSGAHESDNFGGIGGSHQMAGQGGTFDGGGASAYFDSGGGGSVMPDAGATTDGGLSGVSDFKGTGDVLSSFSGTDEAAVPLIVVLVLGALFFSVFLVSFSLLYSAPALFAELLFDGLLAAGLYRRMRHKVGRHWLETAVQHTIKPLLCLAVFVVLFGLVIPLLVPGADSLADVLNALR
ncbi:hypothetical protein PQR62_00920 [Herbaspirillum lusitanum]|uniref:Transmembrane protein n=1 Tax=Herbaspirillum lusitanum TaxID=213312 RepID=A0ABW9A1T0_9BURK